MEIQLIRSNDSLFAESLTKKNMASYYKTRNLVWDRDKFLNSWDDLDNYEVLADNIRVGVIRFSYDENKIYLRDFQLTPECQGKGIGSKCLDLLANQASSQQYNRMVLRVFSENPAVKLYESKGFIRTSEIKGLIEMELDLTRRNHANITRNC